MSKHITINDVYDTLLEKPRFTALETPEIDAEYMAFFRKYILPIHDTAGYENGAEAEADFSSVVWGYNRQGFIAGYKAALNLLIATD